MVDLIVSFAINGNPKTSNADIWKPVGKEDEIPNVLKISNQEISMIPLPYFKHIEVFNEIFTNAKVELI